MFEIEDLNLFKFDIVIKRRMESSVPVRQATYDPIQDATQPEPNGINEDLGENVTSGEQVLYELLFEDKAKNGDTTSHTTINYLTNESLNYLHELNSFHVDRLQLEVIKFKSSLKLEIGSTWTKSYLLFLA